MNVAPILDGNVRSDRAWTHVEPATGFYQTRPTQGAPASRKTEVFVGYTETALWIGVVAYDDRPETMIVAESRRDSSLDQTDSFRMIIDGLLSRQNGYVFGTNPAGMQYDAQVTKEGTTGSFAGRTGDYDENWDGSWEVRSIVGDFGWSAEMEIPFTTLRYGSAEKQTWGINFQRNIRHANEIVYWAPIGQQNTISRLSKAGSLEGIEVPSQRNLQITPYVLAMASRGGEIAGTRSDQEFGFDLKYSLTPSLTLDATYNTDFAQVEVDDVVINLDRFSIFLPEKRPFFLENAGQFSVGDNREVELFFSRRIGIVAGEQVPIEGGVRLSGKVGAATNVGFLYMQDEGLAGVASSNDYMVARVSREMGNRGSIGALYVGRDGDGQPGLPAGDDSNETYAIDGQIGIGENLLLQTWLAKTSTPGLAGKDDAHALKASFNSANWSSRAYYTKVNEDFNPEVGFLQREDYRRAEFFLLRRFRPSMESRLHEVRPHITFRDYWDLSGFLETGFRHYDVHWEFKNGYQVETGFNHRKDGLKEPFEIIDGVFVPAGTYSGGEIQFSFHTDRSAPLSMEMETTAGERFGGDRLVMTPKIQYRHGETFNAELSFEYSDFDLPVVGGDFAVLLTRLRLAYSFSPKMALQMVTQYEDESKTLSTNIRFSLLRTARSGLYIVYNEFDEQLPNSPPAQRQFVVKYNYLFDVFR
ncbi:MAG: carbohydrate binding family 9 domain-containing protein [Woeseiaceae bacterium]|nr:carbohydrate binding family 9 domain-containing protein [Woeseiaceae bacterium]